MTASPPANLRVLHVITRLAFGGAARGTLELITALAAFPSIHCGLYLLHEPESFGSSLRNDPAVRYLGCSRSLLLGYQVLDIAMIANEFEADIVHSHLWPSSLACGLGLIGSRAKHLVHIRDTPPAFQSPRVGPRLRNWALRQALRRPNTRFVSVSSAAAEYAQEHLGIDARRVTVVLNGIDASRVTRTDAGARSYARRGRFVVGSAGRFSPEKGFNVLLEAIAEAHSAGERNVCLRLAGEGSQLATLRKRVVDLSLSDSVELLPPQNDMAQFYASLDAFVSPSLAAEGLSRSLIEAMIVGLPVIASDAPGSAEVVTTNVTGVLVPLGQVRALANAIVKLAQQPETCERLGIQAASFARQHLTVERVAIELVPIYHQMLGRPGAMPTLS